MAISPWHSVFADIYHVCTNCRTGNNIESENIRGGTGNKIPCVECARLIEQNRC